MALLLKHENIVLRLNSVPSYKVSKLVLPLPDHLHTDTRTSLRDISRFTQTWIHSCIIISTEALQCTRTALPDVTLLLSDNGIEEQWSWIVLLYYYLHVTGLHSKSYILWFKLKLFSFLLFSFSFLKAKKLSFFSKWIHGNLINKDYEN